MFSLSEGSDINITVGDFVEGDGVIYGIMEGSNAFGEDVSSVVVETNNIEVGDYVGIVAKVIKSVDVNQILEQMDLNFD